MRHNVRWLKNWSRLALFMSLGLNSMISTVEIGNLGRRILTMDPKLVGDVALPMELRRPQERDLRHCFIVPLRIFDGIATKPDR